MSEIQRLKNLVASAGEYFMKRQKGDGDDKHFEEAYLETALPIMLQLEQDEKATPRDADEVVHVKHGQLGQG